MAKRTGISKRVEVWDTRAGTIRKIAVRHNDGRFNGATNFPVKLTKVKGRPVA